MSKRKSRTGLILMLLGGAMLLGAAGCLAMNLYEENQAAAASASAVMQIRQYLNAADPTAKAQSGDSPDPSLPLETIAPAPDATPLPEALPAEQPLYVQNPGVTMPE